MGIISDASAAAPLEANADVCMIVEYAQGGDGFGVGVGTASLEPGEAMISLWVLPLRGLI
jgi:hypothetical protein